MQLNGITGIVIPSYGTPENGRARYLPASLRSVASQDTDLVCLVVDDGSTDSAIMEIAMDFVGKDPRFFYDRREKSPGERLTASNPLNHGFDKFFIPHKLPPQRVQWIDSVTYLHDDDELAPNGIILRRRALEGAPFSYTPLVVRDETTGFSELMIPPFERKVLDQLLIAIQSVIQIIQ